MGHILTENIHKRFAEAPFYLIHDPDSGSLATVANHCRHARDWSGLQAAQLLVDCCVDTVLAGEMHPSCQSLFFGAGVRVVSSFPATVDQAVAALGAARPASGQEPKTRPRCEPCPRFTFIDRHLSLTGAAVLYDDWDFVLRIPVEQGAPLNWRHPVDWAGGVYHLRVEIFSMKAVPRPIELEVGWSNLPKQEDPDGLHRCSFGPYCSFSGRGTYEHIAFLDDMENTTTDSSEKAWDWSRAWHRPFALIKPYGQNPYPIECRLTITIYGAT